MSAGQSYSPEFVERQYNTRIATPDYARWFAQWSETSSATRRALRCSLDHRYGEGSRETMDLFPAADPRGAFLFIHGGYWRALDKSDFSFVAAPMVESGIGVAVINYDLCPAVSIGEIGEQCRRALIWLKRSGEQHGVPADRLVIGGHSAGGHLTALMFATDWRARGIDGAMLQGGVAISGVFDLEPMVSFSYNADLGLTPETARRWSPSLMHAEVAAPLLLCAGGDESTEFARQSQLMWDAWPRCRPAGAIGPLFLPHHHHFSVVSELSSTASPLTAATLALF